MTAAGRTPAAAGPRPLRVLRRLVTLEPGEGPPVTWSFLYGFLLFASYAMVRPVREEMGLLQGKEHLPRLFQVTLVVTILLHLCFSGLMARLPRAWVVTGLYRVVSLSLLLFAAGFHGAGDGADVWLARGFYVWVSVYNLFAVFVFWALMADVFRSGQAARVFGFILAGGTLGNLTGSSVASIVPELFDAGVAVGLIVTSALVLELAVQCARRVLRHVVPGTAEREPDGRVLAGAVEGLRRIVRSPYLLAICAFMFLYAFTSSVLYFERQEIVAREVAEGPGRIALFARIDLATQTLALVGQLLLAGRFIRSAGITLALAAVPALTTGGFVLLGAWPVLWLVLGLDVLRKGLNYAITRPCREMLYVVVGRAEKYQAKSFIDTFVYRGGDFVAASAFDVLRALTLGLGGIALAAVPAALAWTVVGVFLGRRQARAAARAESAAGAAEPEPGVAERPTPAGSGGAPP